MYTVYADGEIIYSPLLAANDGYAFVSAKVIRELNKAGSFRFTMPPNNVAYGKINKLAMIISVVSSDNPMYVLKNADKTSEGPATSIPTTVIYGGATVDPATGKITLASPLNREGSSSSEICSNYKQYPYFYGDLKDGTEDSTVYRFTSASYTVSTGSITFRMYSYTYYSQTFEKSVQSKELFHGRLLNTEKDFYKRQKAVCEGELAYLVDSIQRPYDYAGDLPELFKQYINNHNEQVDEEKKFAIGEITVSDSNNYVHYSSTVYPNTLNEIKEKLINTHGGYLRTRISESKKYIDYVTKPGKTNSQVIEFGTNLLDITEYITAENVFTVLIPLGERQKDSSGNETGRLTIAEVNDGKDYIESETGIKLFGRITKTHEWDDVTDANNLLKKGKVYLDDGISMSVSLKVKAVDLHLINVNTEIISEGDEVRVVSPPHGIDTYFLCTKIEIDLLTPDNSVYEFGVSFSTLTGKLNK